MNITAYALILAGVLSLLLRFCSIPRKRLERKIINANNAEELLKILETIKPSLQKEKLYAEVHSALKMNAGLPASLEKINQWRAVMLFLIK